jgi:hypothetical protein
MNFTKTKLMLFIFILIAFFSCDNSDVNKPDSLPQTSALVNLTAQEYASIAFDNPKELTETEVIGIAKSFIKAKESVETEKLGTKSSVENTFFKVLSKYYYGKDLSSGILTKSSSKSTDTVKVPIYELTLVSGIDTGLVVVSGDERVQKVIAYIPKTNAKVRKNVSGADYLEGLAKINLVENISEINHLKDSLRTTTLEKIANKIGIDKNNVKFEEVKDYISVNEEPLSKAKPIQTPPSQVLSYVLPMCKAQWDQQSPYNNNLPEGMIEILPGWDMQGHYPTGCAVIALAELMTILKPSITSYGTTINWTYLLENSKIIEPDYFNSGDPADKRNMVANLVKDIYTRTGSGPEINAAGTITGVGTQETACESYIKLYATCNSRQTWNSDAVRNSILAIRPVMAMGSGTKSDGTESRHSFLIDGYLLCKLYYGAMPVSKSTNTKELVQLYDLYFHANFGWGSNSDGYYLINKDTSIDFETDNATYKTGNLRIISNIVKK